MSRKAVSGGTLDDLLQYSLDAILKNEKWAAERYGSAWEQYAKRTKSFIPHVV